ncbi:MAG TPA: hypothetical protein DER23_07995, partial [Clostridiales bacterium]|nr:hypothetical protein [Clostridiales bacterium]
MGLYHEGSQKGNVMKEGIHPQYVETVVTCACGA